MLQSFFRRLTTRPAISDDEASDAGGTDVVVPIVKKQDTDIEDDFEDADPAPVTGDIKMDEDENDEKDGGDEDEELDEDEFIVEKIVGHVYAKGELKFKVKWEGYTKAEDQTWEDEDNLNENASAILEAYFEEHGGREKIISDSQAGTKKKRGRPAATSTPTNGSKRSKRDTHPASGSPPASHTKAWTPPAGSWEDHVASIDACHDEHTGKLVVYLSWRNGQKTQHDTKIVYSRCPQKMLQFYEQHVKIIKSTGEMN
ncbi:hypothetical protein PFICI_10409 [Pestalotiopsis fici W106-1]|uniref:Chromo domain-containing protein n=1 Tax=Pestalotiopsis fici (strain W106-1 / CGMCC3.15140) TaxID=1229662 RepID=W3WZ09_PESFW|nr:uncharacterized protein PFICI_10409 [Pestalotiopsis fici W106-1]ETS78347.1 hypothetical protein PFICI_10409 [Pestalotiopsis fici W106-1]